MVRAMSVPDPSHVAFLIELGGALHRAGVPAHRLEDLVSRVAARLGVDVRTFSTPTSLFLSWDAPEQAKTAFIRVEPGNIDLGRLSEIDQLSGDVIDGTLTPEDAHRKLEALHARPDPYPAPIVALAFVLASATGARLFGGGLHEVLAAATIGLVSAFLSALAGPLPALGRILEGVAAAAAAFVAALAARLYPLSAEVTLLAGLYVFLPGLTFTTAINELATKNLISGTARLSGALVTLFQLSVGVAFGTRAAGFFEHARLPTFGQVSVPLGRSSMAAAIVLGSMALLVLFRARRRDAAFVMGAAALAYVSAKSGTNWLGPQLGAFVGATVLGAASNLVARVFDRAAVITIVPGLMMLVPGSVGFRSLDSLLAGDVTNGVERAFAMAFTGFALVAGLLVANAVVPSRRSL